MTSNLFRSIEDYELFLYTLTEQYPSVARSTLALIRIGTSMARVSGEVYFHIQPDIKHHRIPASGMKFLQPNLPALIEEIEKLG
jgi:hypothetical protein